MTTAKKVVGESVRRMDGPDKVTGRGKYGLDAHLPGTLWMKILRSPFPHARIVRVDASAAKALPGVHGVLTGQDVKGMYRGGMLMDEPLLCWERVRLVGDKVAAVVAMDEDTAQQALNLIEVEYEELPAVTDAVEAAKPGAPILHPDFNTYAGATPMQKAGNRYAGMHHEMGDVQKGFKEADIVIEKVYKTPLIHQGYLEPHTCLVNIEPDGTVQVWMPSQGPQGVQQELVRLFNLPAEKVNLNPTYIGGSFGGKGSTAAVPLAYLFAKMTGRPVKWSMDYEEEFQNMDMRHPATMRIKTGVKRDGTITAWEAEVHLAGGAYASYAPLPALAGIMEIVGPYKIANVKIDSHQLYTNTSPCGYARAPGHPQGIFAGESHMDVMARAIGMDPLEFRLKNVVHDGDVLPNGHHFQDLRADEALRRAAEVHGWHSPRPANVGRGIAIGSHSQIGATSHVAIKVHDTGRVEINHPVYDPGIGTGSLLAQIASEELQVPLERIDVKPWSTADPEAKFDFGIGGSRGARMYSAAGYAAAQETKNRLRQLAAEFFGWTEERITFQDGNLVNESNNERVPLEEIARRLGEPVMGRTDQAEGFDSPWTSYAVNVVDIACDKETGEYEFLKYTVVQETGRMLNPQGFEGQVQGGLVQGIGQALMEGLFYDESGRVINPSFADMKIPTARDIPQLKTVVMESEAGHGQYKVRGVGEHSNSMAAPAIANAIENGFGVRITETPLTSEKVYKALREQAKAGGAKSGQKAASRSRNGASARSRSRK
jgi:CO/xanthine dehydrogenase Mo-binding subunit